MLMQSAHGYINILPALPAVWEKTGAVTGMKAMGNFTVDFNWADGKCQKVTIVSNAGAELRVRCARGARDIATTKVTVDGVEVRITINEHGIATIPCKQGSTVVIDYTAEGSSVAKLKAEKKNKKIFALDGREVTHSDFLAKGVYISAGKKLLRY